MSSEVFGPEVDGAALGLTGQKQLSPDFNKGKFADLIETKGYRLAWSRAAVCPCKSVDDQTVAPDMNCPLCTLIPGFLFFRPESYNLEAVAEIGDLTDVQKYIIDRDGSPSVVIRGVITSVARNQEAYSQIGDWVFGSFNVTTRPENRIGYYDRIVALDSVMPYSQIVHMIDQTGPVSLRFPAVKVSLCRTLDRVFKEGIDFDVDTQGRLVFVPGRRPPFQSRVSVHYEHHPQFILIEHVNSFRDSVQGKKNPGLQALEGKSRQTQTHTPVGTHMTLPIRGVAKLEFLLGQGAAQ